MARISILKAPKGSVPARWRPEVPRLGAEREVILRDAEVRQPLLAGAGTQFTRVAGPIRPGFGAIAGVSQGVVIARINQDITLADFEIAVRNGLRDIENAYWDLYLAYRLYDTTVSTHQSAFQTWREARTKLEVGTLKQADELQARE